MSTTPHFADPAKPRAVQICAAPLFSRDCREIYFFQLFERIFRLDRRPRVGVGYKGTFVPDACFGRPSANWGGSAVFGRMVSLPSRSVRPGRVVLVVLGLRALGASPSSQNPVTLAAYFARARRPIGATKRGRSAIKAKKQSGRGASRPAGASRGSSGVSLPLRSGRISTAPRPARKRVDRQNN